MHYKHTNMFVDLFPNNSNYEHLNSKDGSPVIRVWKWPTADSCPLTAASHSTVSWKQSW